VVQPHGNRVGVVAADDDPSAARFELEAVGRVARVGEVFKAEAGLLLRDDAAGQRPDGRIVVAAAACRAEQQERRDEKFQHLHVGFWFD